MPHKYKADRNAYLRKRYAATHKPKYCKACDTELPPHRTSFCSDSCKRVSHKSYKSERDKRKAEEFRQYKLELGCSVCGYNKCAAALDHHHPNKDAERGALFGHRFGSKVFMDELAKCVILCANCHRELHWEDKNSTLHLPQRAVRPC